MIITGPAYGTQSSFCAYQFCLSLLNNSTHTLHSIFFYADGTYNANRFTNPANDEFHLVEAWQTLAKTHHIKLSVCIAAAQRRGVTQEEFANNIANEFELVGLGDLSDSVAQCDRVIQF
ncbi:tRNA 2-thiouridine synthesizing protein D [Orbus hercynius]|uniref:tRNA 2-thiouridine synthesizing protein D n=1 Tax=Orbus hercynius TaxID=593135 RepID=A0A495RE54_9GAMM|nr:tRNA 2-thiouridine synthesizing protein D [Orbus hercynius]